MRPKKLIISAWGPYREIETVDFSSLAGRGLFLIAGPTGAGKTTIFDAMTFALYGQVSGSLRGTDQVRSDFSGEDEKTWVEFTFAHKGEEYRIYRNPTYERKKKRGEGYTTERERAVLYLPGGEAVEGNIPVNRALQELLGIDALQFKQLSMIAQGEFMRLLTAKADERRDIFRKVFRLGRYERMRQAIQSRERELRSQILTLRERLLEEAEELAAKDASLTESVTERAVDWDGLLSGSAAVLEKRRAALVREQTENEARTLLLKERSAALEQKERCNRQLEELSAVREALLRLQKQEDEIKESRNRVQLGRRALALSADAAAAEVLLRQKQELCRSEEQERARETALAGELEKNRPLYEEIQAGAEPEKQRQEMIRLLADTAALAKELSGEEERLAGMLEAYAGLEKAYQCQRERYEQMERRCREAAVGLAARYLVEGMPCPVCGSLTHPHKAQVSDEVPDEKVLEAERKKTDRLQEQLRLNTEQTSGQRGRVQEKQKVVRTQLAACHLEDDAVPDRGSRAESTDMMDGGRTALMEVLQERLRLLREESRKYQEKAAGVAEAYEEKQRQLGLCRAAKERMTEELCRVSEQYAVRQKAFLAACEENGFADEAAYRSARMEEAKLAREEARITDFLQKRALLAQKEEQLARETQDFRREDLTKEQEALAGLEKAMREGQERQLALHTGIAEIVRLRESMEEQRGRQETLETEYGRVADIARAAAGSNRQNMLFEDYVIAGYFDRILQSANQRLLRMSSGRYELTRILRAADARSRDSLEMEVLDYHTGKRRAVKTLSGGEAFKAALALALGMADIVQQSVGGVEIEVLFIDEGFGSLDQESLDQAVDTLASLAGSGRMIGIISHVEELKERIDAQITVERRPQGSRIRGGIV